MDGNLNPKFLSAPAFATAPFMTGDYRLQDNSPAINKGLNSYLPAAITKDLNGDERAFGRTIDLGAFERQLVPLPVTLVSFTAKIINQTAALQWTTASEDNNDHFVIYRSSDGINFTAIATKNSFGNTAQSTSYTYIDLKPHSGINYYRITQVDENGKMTELGVKPLNFAFEERLAVNVYPNPVKETINISFPAAKGDSLSVKLADITGKIITQKILFRETGDTWQLKLNQKPLAGVYFLTISSSRVTKTVKVIAE